MEAEEMKTQNWLRVMISGVCGIGVLCPLLFSVGCEDSEKKHIEADDKKTEQLLKATEQKYGGRFDTDQSYQGEASYPAGSIVVKEVKCPQFKRLVVGRFYGMLGVKTGLPFCVMSKNEKGDMESFAIDFNQNNDLSDEVVYPIPANGVTADISLDVFGQKVMFAISGRTFFYQEGKPRVHLVLKSKPSQK